jgi:hypothetical protein
MNSLFRTTIQIEKPVFSISVSDPVFMAGSCFSENIYIWLRDYKFDVLSNPSGTLFNPGSIASMISRLSKDIPYPKIELFKHNDLWRHFDFHSDFAFPDKEETLSAINNSINRASEHIKKTNRFIFTFGSAWIYTNKETNQVVSNCHQLPEKHFIRSLASVETIVSIWTDCINTLRKLNPECKIIFTVSPVRHLRDKPHENTVSKAHLHAAICMLEQQFPFVSYFPAFEIMIDELRDYRFYNADMIHPNNTAIEYIQSRFSETFFSDSTTQFIYKYSHVLAAKKHKIKFPETEQGQKFIQSQIERINRLSNDYKEVDFSSDLSYFNQYIK